MNAKTLIPWSWKHNKQFSIARIKSTWLPNSLQSSAFFKFWSIVNPYLIIFVISLKTSMWSIGSIERQIKLYVAIKNLEAQLALGKSTLFGSLLKIINKEKRSQVLWAVEQYIGWWKRIGLPMWISPTLMKLYLVRLQLKETKIGTNFNVCIIKF